MSSRASAVICAALIASSLLGGCTGLPAAMSTPSKTSPSSPSGGLTRTLVPVPTYDLSWRNPHYPLQSGAVAAMACVDAVDYTAFTKQVLASGGTIFRGVASVVPTDSMLVESAPVTRVRLSQVQILAGPRLDLREGWIRGGPTSEGTPGPQWQNGSLWAPDGQVIGVALPRADKPPAALQLTITPVVGDLMIISDAGCWWDQATPKFEWYGPLEELPGARTIETEGYTIAAIKLQAFLDAVNKASR